MRLFTAIDIPEAVKQNLQALIERLRPTAHDSEKISWSRIDNLHVTTKFIGEWPETRLDELKSMLAEVDRVGEIEISLRGIGWFPNPKNPRVLWTGVEAAQKLADLARSTGDAVHAIGVEKEDRPYAPHLTLARIREQVPLTPLRDAIDALRSTDFGSFRASSFYLYLSAGGRYTRLAEFSLA